LEGKLKADPSLPQFPSGVVAYSIGQQRGSNRLIPLVIQKKVSICTAFPEKPSSGS